MTLALIDELTNWRYLLTSPFTIVVLLFQIWMFVDACRRREWIWALFIVLFSVFSAVFYFFMVYRNAAGSLTTSGFELPGTFRRQRIRELEQKIHDLDHAAHHLAVGDIYFQQGKLDKAEACYRAALERDSQDIDIRAHLGQCLLRKGKPADARPLLESVCRENMKHDYGYSLMAYAETLAAVGDMPSAIQTWRIVLQSHSYARARFQLAELLAKQGEKQEVRHILEELIVDDRHSPKFQRRREAVWVRRAKSLLRTVS
jgi:hypothetical protein